MWCVYIYVCDVCVYIYTYIYMWCSGNLDASEALSLYKVHIFIHTYTQKTRMVCLLFWLLLLLHVCARVCMFLCVHCCDASELLGWAACKFDSRMENMKTIKRKRARDGGCKVGRAHAASCASHITPSCAQHTIELRQIT